MEMLWNWETNLFIWYNRIRPWPLRKIRKGYWDIKGNKEYWGIFFDNGKRHYRLKFDRTEEQEIHQQDYELLKEVLGNESDRNYKL